MLFDRLIDNSYGNSLCPGPLKTDRPVEDFVVVMESDNPTCVINTSTQFSKMAVDYYYEKVCI